MRKEGRRSRVSLEVQNHVSSVSFEDLKYRFKCIIKKKSLLMKMFIINTFQYVSALLLHKINSSGIQTLIN